MRRLALLALLLLAVSLVAAGCGSDASSGGSVTEEGSKLPGDGRPPVTLGTRVSPEQILLGQLYKQALEAQGFEVRLKQNIGSTEIADRALRNGEIDLYPEYVGVFDRAVAHDPLGHASAASALAAGRTYAAQHGFTLLAPTPFENVDAIAVTPELAKADEIDTIADLRTVRGLRLGARPELIEGATGLPGLARAYGLDDVTFAPLTEGLQYPALDEDRIDAAVVRTTDPQLAEGDYVLLGDPARLFGFEPVVPVVASRVLEAEGPAFARALDAVSARLTTVAMQKMNAALEDHSAEDVARDFLQQQDLT